MTYAYGCPELVDGSPVGGGVGYLHTISPAGAVVASTLGDVQRALTAAVSGKIVYVADALTGSLSSLAIPKGVLLAGGRGRPGVIPAHLKISGTVSCAVGAGVSGLVLEGPASGTKTDYGNGGITTVDGSEIANNEIFGFPGYAVCLLGLKSPAQSTGHFHHNDVHHCQKVYNADGTPNGTGYGVLVSLGYPGDISQRAMALVEGNKFDVCRHFIAATAGRTSYVFRYNLLGPNCVTSQIDVHGQTSSDSLKNASGEYLHPAGEDIKVYCNTSLLDGKGASGLQPLVWIRGIPYSTGKVEVYRNWSHAAKESLAISDGSGGVGCMVSQSMKNMPGYLYTAPTGGAFVRMVSHDNWWGTTPPPSGRVRLLGTLRCGRG